MKICVVGTGYVGLVAGTCFAETGNDVICMDVDEKKIAGLQEGKLPIYEPGLQELIRRNVQEERLRFTTDLTSAVQESLIVSIAVGTPQGDGGSSDLSYVMDAVRAIAKAMNDYKIIVTKSTVPVGTADNIAQEISALTAVEFDVVANPEFLKAGAAVEDFMKPDRVVIGATNTRVVEIMQDLYAPFTRTGAPILVMDPRSAEMTKYAANAMLASRISFMNEIANLCERTGANVNLVRQAIAKDRRIGASFLFPGLGYGGSCFPKDVKALIHLAHEHDYPLKLIQAVEEVNELQKRVMIHKILDFYSSETGNKKQDADHSPLKGKTFAIWGLAFKPQTNDMREAPSRVVIEELLALRAKIQAFDPEAMKEARKIFGDKITYAKNNYEALKGADALILVTEWNEFRNPDFKKMKALLKDPVIFDGRNQYSRREMRELGFDYVGVGRPSPA